MSTRGTMQESWLHGMLLPPAYVCFCLPVTSCQLCFVSKGHLFLQRYCRCRSGSSAQLHCAGIAAESCMVPRCL